MNDDLLRRVQPHGTDEDSLRIRETVSLSFARMKEECTVQNAQGGSGRAVTAGSAIPKNKEA